MRARLDLDIQLASEYADTGNGIGTLDGFENSAETGAEPPAASEDAIVEG
jgi:hypothetical protein